MMARARRAVLKATDVGGSDPNKQIALAVPGKYPEDYQDEGAVWKAGYDKCANTHGGQTEKSCVIYANNYQGEEMSDSEIEAEIERLTKIRNGES